MENINKKVVSVIVTVHNAEKYLRECLDSVVNQTYKDIEIICVDGGSKDASPKILKEYQLKDSRIKIINDTNTSYGHKINIGIDSSLGDYIAVIESDDIYEKNMIEVIMNIFNKYNDLDFVNGEYKQFWDIEGIRHYIKNRLYYIQPYNCVIDNTGKDRQLEIMNRYWTGIYKKSFIINNKIRLNESPGASFQDMSFRFLLSVLAKKIYHLDIPVYKYRMDNAASSMKDSSKILTIVYEHKFLENELIKRNIKDKDIWIQKYYWKYLDFNGNMSNLLLPEGQEILYNSYIEELKKDIVNIPDYSLEKYPFTDIEKMINKREYLEEKKLEYSIIQENNKQLINFWCLLDKGFRFVIFGCGQRGLRYKDYFNQNKDQLIAFTDNASEKWGRTIDGIKVYSPGEIKQKYKDIYYLIANATQADNIYKQLINIGIDKNKIISCDI